MAGLPYVIGLITNNRLLASAKESGEVAKTAYSQKQRLFAGAEYRAGS